jgi:DNA-binding beta-propeller fold protein YncE
MVLISLAGCQAEPSQVRQNGVSVTLTVGKRPGTPVIGGGYVWVPNTADGTITKIDASTSQIVATIPIGTPSLLLDAGCGALDVHSFPVGSFDVLRCDLPSALLFFGDSLWVARNGGSLTSEGDRPQGSSAILRIDPRTNRTIATIPTALEVFGLAGGISGVWVLDYQHDTVAQIDPFLNEVARTYRGLGLGPTHAVVTSTAVWIAMSRADEVVELDPASGRVLASFSVGKQPLAMGLSADGELWVRNEKSSSMTVIEVNTATVMTTVPVDFFLGRDGQDGLAILGPSVWISGLTLDQVSVVTHVVVRRLNHPGIALTGVAQTLWVVDLAGTISRLDIY